MVSHIKFFVFFLKYCSHYCIDSVKWMDGWMTCDFKPVSTVFQSYQEDGQIIMEGCVLENPVYN